MKVLILTTDCTGPGGVQYVGRLLVRALKDCLGPESTLTLLTVKDRQADLASVAAECRMFAGNGSRIRTGWTGLRLLRRERWDLVMLAHLNLAPLLLAISADRRPATIAWMHGIEAWGPIGRLRRRALLRADSLLYNSCYTRQRSDTTHRWLARREAGVCPLGLLPEADCPQAAPPNGESFALCIGRMARAERYKGHEELIRAWPAVRGVTV